MIRRIRRVFWCLLVLLMIAPTWTAPTLLAQEEATPSGEGTNQLFEAEGVDAPVLSSATIDSQNIAEPRFFLERLELPLGSAFTEHAATTTELLYVEAGTVSIVDNFGFTSSATGGDSLNLIAGTAYSLSNDGTESVSLLRASLGRSQDALPLASPVVSDSATPIGQQATPITDEGTNSGTTTVLIDLPIDTLPTGESSLFLAQMIIAPGSESGEQAHAGPIALYIEEGTMTVQSPSGLSGQLQAGQAVALPVIAPLVASNQGTDEAVAYVMGVVDVVDGLMVEVTPAPEPTPTPSPAPTAVPTEIPVPTETPEPTPTPEPALRINETFTTAGSTLQLTGAGGYAPATYKIDFIYTNTGNTPADFQFGPSSVTVTDDMGNTWEVWSPGPIQRHIVQPGETLYLDVVFYRPSGGGDRIATVEVKNLGDIERARWEFVYEG